MKGGLGEMPLTLWVIVAAIILYLYIRRASLGIDKHPGEAVTVRKGKPPIPPGLQQFLPPDTSGLRVIPIAPTPPSGGLLQ